MKKAGLNRTIKVSVDYNAVDINDILDIHRYLMKKKWFQTMFELIKKMFIRLLAGLVNGSNHTKCASLSNQYNSTCSY